MEPDKRAVSQWNKSQISYTNYMNFILNKTDKFELNFVDLLHVSNFKGGYATINEPEEEIIRKLVPYGQLFYKIDSDFGSRRLNELDDSEIEELISLAEKLIELTDLKSKSKIDGFSVSFLTTLLHFYFPNLYPIMDRRVLNGLDLITDKDLDSQNQVKNIKRFYPKLIRNFRQKTKGKTIRELDNDLFIIQLHQQKNINKHKSN